MGHSNEYNVKGPEERTGSERHQLSPTLLEGFRAHSWRTIEAISAIGAPAQEEWLRDGETQAVSSVYLSPDGISVLGIVPTLGRLPTEVEREALLSERFWRTDFGADPDIVGSLMSLEWGEVLIVGVAPLPSGYPDDVDTVRLLRRDKARPDRRVRMARQRIERLEGQWRMRTLSHGDGSGYAWLWTSVGRHAV